jgi:hypothetical protein
MIRHSSIRRPSAAFSLRVDAIHYPAIYAPRVPPMAPDDRSEFSVSFDTSNFDPNLLQRWLQAGPRRRRTDRLAHAKANTRPWVKEASGDYAGLAAVFAEADLRNVSRDQLLNKTPATLYLIWAPWEHKEHGSGEILGLLGVTIHVEALVFP